MTKLATLTFSASAAAALFSKFPHASQAFVPATSYHELRHHRYHIVTSQFTEKSTPNSFPLFSTAESSSSNQQAETEAEKMLRRARELLAEASAEEENLRASLIGKKQNQDTMLDQTVQDLFPSGQDTAHSTFVANLRKKHLSTDMLIHIIERLHEREIAAKGYHHVEQASHHDHTKFKVVSSNEPNHAELAKVSGLIDKIVDAAKVLDEEFRSEKKDGVIHHTEKVHWSSGDVSGVLMKKVRDLRREHDEQFKRRQEEFYEAARRKKNTNTDKDTKP